MFVRSSAFAVLAILATTAANAGDHYYYPTPMFASPGIVYAGPLVPYYPSYVVPPTVVAVPSVHMLAPMPMPSVVYPSYYYTPMVSAVVAHPVMYRTHFHYRHPRRLPRGYRGVEIEYERDGDIEIDYR
jgi:hypothetical protein